MSPPALHALVFLAAVLLGVIAPAPVTWTNLGREIAA